MSTEAQGAAPASGGQGAPASGTPEGSSNQPAGAWYDAHTQDAGLREYVKTKGWDGFESTVKSYQNAEKLIGADPNTIVRLPKAGDAEAQRALYARLVMPEAADKYDIDQSADLPLDANYMQWARGEFHKLGLSNDQAKNLTTAHNEYIRQALAQEAKDYELGVQSDAAALKREWGGGYDRMMLRAEAAVKALGFTGEMIDGLEQAVGYAGVMKFMAELGAKVGEDKLPSGDGKPGGFSGALTPQEAKAQWDQALLDTNFRAALTDRDNPGHKAAKQKQSDLFAIMYPEG